MTRYERKLRKEMEYHLSLCTTEHERIMCKTICEKEIGEKLNEKEKREAKERLAAFANWIMKD